MNFFRTCLYIFLACIFLSGVTCAEEHKSIKLGVVVALTGPVSVHGVPIKNAISLAKKELDKSNQIELILEDDSFQASKSVTAVNKLINYDKVDAILQFGTNQGLATVDLAERASIPFYSLNVNRRVVEGRKNAFIFLPSIQSAMEPLINESKKRGYKKVFVVSSAQDSCVLQAEIFKEKSGVEIMQTDDINPAEIDLGGLAVRIRSKRPSAVFLTTLPPQGALLAKKLREVGFKGQIFASIQEASFSELALSNNALLDAYVISGDNRKAISFLESYKKEYGVSATEGSDYAVDGYIAFQLILEGLRSGDSRNYLLNLKDFKSAVGPISADGHQGFTFPLALKKFAKDGFEYLED